MLTDWKFNHIGVAVQDLESSAKIYRDSGYSQSEPVYDSKQNVYVCFLTKIGAPTIELLAPHDRTSPIQLTLDKMGVTPYHICYEVIDIDKAIEALKKMCYVVVRKPESAIAMGYKRVCFLYNKNVGLIEIVEQ